MNTTNIMNTTNNSIHDCSICTSKKCIEETLNNINLSNNNQLNKNKTKNEIKKIKLDEIFIHNRNQNNTKGCKQKFHKSCIIRWFEKSKTKNCPICRGLINSDDPNIVRVFQNQVQNQVKNNNFPVRFPFTERRNVFNQLI